MTFFKLNDYSEDAFRNVKGPFLNKEQIRRIIVLVGKPHLGDLILSIPFFKTLSNYFPNAEIIYVGEIPVYIESIFNLLPNVSLFYFPKHKKIHSIKYWFKLYILGIVKHIDLSIDTQRYFVPSLLFRFVRGTYHLGYSSKCFFSNWKFKEKNRKEVHDAYQTLLLLKVIGIKEIDTSPTLTIPEKYKNIANQYILQNNLEEKKLIAFFPGAGMKIKMWPEEYFIELGNLLKNIGSEVLIFGDSKERKLLEKFNNNGYKVPGFQNSLFFNDPLYTASLLKFCKFAVTNDCGGAHLSSFAGIPVISIFGPSSPLKFSPLGEKNIIFYKNFSCSPCKQSKIKNCKFNRKCLTSITPDEVFMKIKKFFLTP